MDMMYDTTLRHRLIHVDDSAQQKKKNLLDCCCIDDATISQSIFLKTV